jgi:uncharacterized protein YbjT (DUF2867 family)
VDLLVERGITVTALARSDAAAHALRERGASVVRGDLSQPAAWQGAAASADVIFHAGQPRMVPPLRGRHVKRLVRQSRGAAEALAGALGPDATVVMASCGLGAEGAPLRIAEPSQEAERALSGPGLRVVRIPWAYGPGGFIRDIARGLQMGRMRIVGPGGNRIALVGARDAAAALLAAADAPPGRYGIEEADAPTQVEFIHHLCAGRGATRPDHLPPRMASLSMGGVVVEALMADQRVPGGPPPGFSAEQAWQRDLLDALIG